MSARLRSKRMQWILALALTILGTGISLLSGDGAGAEESSFGKEATEAKTAAEHGGDKAHDDKSAAEAKTVAVPAQGPAIASNGKDHRDSPPPIAAIRDNAATAPGACLVDSAAIEDVQKRRAELEARDKALAAREAELKAKERALDEELRKLEIVRDEIGKADGAEKTASDEKITKLVETFQSMSPKAAATILATVDEGLAVAAMARIETPRLAKIMNVMEAGRVSRLSELLAGVIRARRIQSAKGGEKNDGQNINEREQQSARGPASSGDKESGARR